MKKILVSLVFAALATACSSPADPAAKPSLDDAGVANSDASDAIEVIHGTPDRGRDPAVVAIDVGETGLCTGALIAPDVVLTARHCVAQTSEAVDCPPRAPQVHAERAPSSLRILVGDSALDGQVAAAGRHILTPKGNALCDADIALIVLDRPIEGIEPLAIAGTGASTGDRVRSIGYGRADTFGPAGIKLRRDHVRVVSTSRFEFVVGEATCQGDSGGPAIDEERGDIVGVISRGGPGCSGARVHNIYTRTDAFMPLIEAALQESSTRSHAGAGKGNDPTGDSGSKDAGAPPRSPHGDVGIPCASGTDCATGLCIEDRGSRYCSRKCGIGTRCPAQYHCVSGPVGALCLAQ